MKTCDQARRNKRISRAANALRALLLSDVEQVGQFDLEHIRNTILKLDQLVKPVAKSR